MMMELAFQRMLHFLALPVNKASEAPKSILKRLLDTYFTMFIRSCSSFWNLLGHTNLNINCIISIIKYKIFIINLIL